VCPSQENQVITLKTTRLQNTKQGKQKDRRYLLARPSCATVSARKIEKLTTIFIFITIIIIFITNNLIFTNTIMHDKIQKIYIAEDPLQNIHAGHEKMNDI